MTQEDIRKEFKLDTPATYRIRVQGRLDYPVAKAATTSDPARFADEPWVPSVIAGLEETAQDVAD